MSEIVLHALVFAKKKHGSQKDDCGKDYFTAHIHQVVRILTKVTSDYEVIATAFLHDTLEDTNTTEAELRKEFGDTITDLVLEVTHEGSKEKGYYFPRLHSEKAILVKFADRLSNLSRMNAWNKKRRDHYLLKSQFWRIAEVKG